MKHFEDDPREELRYAKFQIAKARAMILEVVKLLTNPAHEHRDRIANAVVWLENAIQGIDDE